MLLRAHVGSEKTACENSVPFPTYSVRGLVHSGVFGVGLNLLDELAIAKLSSPVQQA